ncbi:proton-conducting transporter membrane subunit [Maridesulfovibrio sp.]|uniref:proton-conducting transporter transmembrane domain-containing protein n=1 Tax=Maridesulfovibrio sp. TaxID=2795000 RepID=UPI003BA98C48
MFSTSQTALVAGAILLVLGEVLALSSAKNLKRLLLFSTLAECGYLLIGFGTASVSGAAGALLHLTYQSVIRGLCFLAAYRLAMHAGSWNVDNLRGIHRAMPYTSVLFGFAMFSFMGLSPFKGAISKFVIMYAAIENGNYIVAAACTLGTIIAAMYIIKVIQAVCFEKISVDESATEYADACSFTGIICVALAATTALLTISPEPLIHACEELALDLLGTHQTSGLPHFEQPWPTIVLVPYLGAFAVFLVGRYSYKLRNILISLTTLASICTLWLHSGLDELSALIALLYTFICSIVVLYSIGYVGNRPHSNRYFFFLFLMFGSLIGVATASDLGTFYLFWELMTWTSYLLVIHKQTEKALRAGYKYFIMCVSGACIMHYGILLWHSYSGSFEIASLYMPVESMPLVVMACIAVMFFVGLGVKAGLFPFHSWLPDAHPVAPSSISAPMSGILTKAGIVGLLKFIPLFASGAVPIWIATEASILPQLTMMAGACTLLIGEVKALRQNDIKRMLAYSTLAQVGEIALILGIDSGLTTTAALGHIINHAVIKSLLFLSAGAFILRAGTQSIDQLSGLGKKMPLTGAWFAIGTLSIMGLPPFNGFISKFLMLHAAVQTDSYIIAGLILTGSLIGIMYYARLLKVLFFQSCVHSEVKEAPMTMQLGMMALAAVCIIFGLQPKLWMNKASLAAEATWRTVDLLPDLTLNWPVATLLPLAGAAVIALLRSNRSQGIAAAVLTAMTGVLLLLTTPETEPYALAFSLLVVASATLCFIYSAGYMDHSHTQWRFYGSSLFMISGLIGLSLSTNLFNFFAFWEIMSSWPLFFVIIHEESQDALAEGSKYFLFNMAGASVLLIGILLLGNISNSYDLQQIAQALPDIPATTWLLPIGLIGIGLLMKAAMLPLRIDWQMHPSTAPTPISGYISAVLLKSAPIGFILLCFVLGHGILPSPEMQGLMYISAWIAGVTIFYAAYKAVTHSSIKLVLIYSTVSQMGYILLGICLGTSLGIAGGMLHLVNHMVFKNLAFLCAGALMYRTHAHSLDELGGIGQRMPLTTLAFGISALSAAGVPPFSGFTSKWILYTALIEQNEILLALLALSGSVLTLAYFAKFLHSAFFGHLSPKYAHIREAKLTMLIPMCILSAISIVTGIFPGLLLKPIATIESSLGITPIATSLGGITGGSGEWNASLMAFMLLIPLCLSILLLRILSRKVRRTGIHLCGVTELPPKETNVSASNLYEAPLQFVERLRGLIQIPFFKEKA